MQSDGNNNNIIYLTPRSYMKLKYNKAEILSHLCFKSHNRPMQIDNNIKLPNPRWEDETQIQTRQRYVASGGIKKPQRLWQLHQKHNPAKLQNSFYE